MRVAKRLETVSLCSSERLAMSELLKTEHLSVSFFTDAGEVEAVRDVSFTVRKGKFWQLWENPDAGKVHYARAL